MYTDFWGLRKPPFDNVPDPSMYVDSHVSVENTIAETLFAIEEGNECLTVIVGDVGLGKTMSLRMILDSLDHEKYKIAFVTNPDMSFVQLLKEIIGQLMGKECEIRGKIELLEVFNKLLFETADEGKKILIFIDEANAISPTNLESLRLLTNMQDDDRNLFTIVLAGQLEFAKRLEHRSRANLYQRIGTYNKIEKMESEEVVRKYIETRMRLAGAVRKIFTDEAIHWLWEYSEHGVPRLLNKIAKLCLKAGETNNFHEIGGEVVQQIGERFEKMTGPAVQKRKVSPGSRVSNAPEKRETEPAHAPEKPPRPARVRREEVSVSETWNVAPPPPPPPPPPVFESVSSGEVVKTSSESDKLSAPGPEVETVPQSFIPEPVQSVILEEGFGREEEFKEEDIEEISIETNSPPPLSFEAIIGREVEEVPVIVESSPDLPDLGTEEKLDVEEQAGFKTPDGDPAELHLPAEDEVSEDAPPQFSHPNRLRCRFPTQRILRKKNP